MEWERNIAEMKWNRWVMKYHRSQDMGWGLSVAVALLSACYITATVYAIQPGPLWEALAYTKNDPLLFWLNFLPPLLGVGAAWFLTNRLLY